MYSRVSSHSTEQSMCIPQENFCVRHSSQKLGTRTPGTGKWQWESCTQEPPGLLLLSDFCVRLFIAQYRQFLCFYLLLA